MSREWPFGEYFDGIRANLAGTGATLDGHPADACGYPLRAEQIGRNGWAGYWLEAYFRETPDADPVANGQSVIDAFVAAATPYVGTDWCKLPATLAVTVTGTRSSTNATLQDALQGVQKTVEDAVAGLTGGLLDTVQRGAVLLAILAVILLGAATLFREPVSNAASALIAARTGGKL